MKMRSDFVTNSSSSSFIVSREYQNQTMTKELYDALIAEAICEYMEKRKTFLPYCHKYGLAYDEARDEIYNAVNGSRYISLPIEQQEEIEERYGISFRCGDWTQRAPEVYQLHWGVNDIRDEFTVRELQDFQEIIDWNWALFLERLSPEEIEYMEETQLSFPRFSPQEIKHMEKIKLLISHSPYYECDVWKDDVVKVVNTNDEKVIELIGKSFGYFYSFIDVELHIPPFILEKYPELYACYSPHMG